MDEGGDVLRVLRVREVDALRAGDEVGVEDDFAGGFEARGAVDVQGDGVVCGVAVVAGGANGALHARLGAVGADDVVPEDADFGGEGVGPRAGFEVEGGVGGDGVVVAVGVRLDVWAGEFDEGVWVVEETGADGGVVDPGRGGHGELVGLLEAGQDGGVADAGFHEEFGGFQSAVADNDAPSRGEGDGGDDAARVGDDACGEVAGADDAGDPGSGLEVEVGAGEGGLEVADCGAAALGVVVVVDGVAEDLCFVGGVCVDGDFGEAGAGHEPVFGGRVAGLLVKDVIIGRDVAGRLRRIQSVDGRQEIGMLPARGKVVVEVGGRWFEEQTGVDCAGTTNGATDESVNLFRATG